MTSKDPQSAGLPDDDRPDWDRLEDEVQVMTFRASGPGGQHRNKTESAVRVTHLPTGVTARASESRSQYRNRVVAMQRLRERLEARFAEKVPRRPSTVPRREKERRIREKKQRSQVKALRKAPEPDGE
ncbi:MAG: peptide chain release factor-like protein [Candidatus Neomarinimicrobiota bacterium]